MRHAGILIALGLTLAAGSCGRTPGDVGVPKQPAAAPRVEKPAEPAPVLRVPAGFKAKEGATVEPYSKTGWAKEIVHEKSGMAMSFIPAGEFMMGSPPEESKWPPDQCPVHRVRITKPFYMGTYEVTQGEWSKVMGNARPRAVGRDRMPMGGIGWDDCRQFAAAAGDGLRMPTEAEWEYACRAGTRTPFNFGGAISTDNANYNGTKAYRDGPTGVFRNKPMEVGSFKPNAWGLYDMHGNMLEWCADWYGKDYYTRSPVDDPPGPAEGTTYVQRGGSFYYSAEMCRSAYRIAFASNMRHGYSGFRAVLDVK